MSDYLQNLVERSIAPIPAVRPKLPSLFEPRPAKSPVDGPTGSDLPADSPVAATSTFPLEAGQTPAKPATKPVPEASPPFPAKIVIQSQPAVFPDAPPRENPETISRDNLHLPAVRNDALKPAVPEVSFRSTPASLPQAPTSGSLRWSTEKVAADSSISAEIRPRSVPDRKPFPRDFRSDSSTDRKENGSGPARTVPAPTPTIQVTIGRVEIRAAAPSPAPTRAGTKKGPAMSLENYLNRRAGGGRDE